MLDLSPEVQQRLIDRSVREVLTPRDRAACAGQRVLVTGAGGSVGSDSEYPLVAMEQAARVLEALRHVVTDFIPSNAAVEAAAGGHKQCVEHVRLSAVAAASSGDISFRH